MKALDKKISFSMFIKGIGNKLQSIMAKSISPEDKLQLIQDEMEKDVQTKKVTAREIRAKMTAICDPDTAELEPLEKLKTKRERLVKLGSQTLKEPDSQEKTNKLARITKEIKTIDASLGSLETTYKTLKESYEIAIESYKTAVAAFEHVKSNGSAILFSIKAHKDALAVRDNLSSSDKIDSSFLDDLQAELENTQRELRSENQINKDLDSEKIDGSILDSVDASEIDSKIMEEFKA